jgi:hypothetical protein
LSDGVYLGAGCVGFLLSMSVLYAGWSRLLGGALRSSEPALRRRALRRWIRFVLVWQALVLMACAAYVLSAASAPRTGYAWPAPALGLVFGTALALQVSLLGILRAARR